jgi:LPS export ABC transporter protein LptC/lipopolysaccharide transport protein LptA
MAIRLLTFFKTKHFIAPLAILLVGLLIYLVFIKDTDVKKRLNQVIPKYAQFTINGFSLFETMENGKNWNLKATFADVYKDQNIANLKGVKVVFYNTDGKIFKLFGDEGTVNLDSKEARLHNNVRIESDDGYVIKTQELKFIPKIMLLTTDEKVVLEGPSVLLKGQGLRGKVEKRTISLLKDVTTEIKNSKPDKLIKISKNTKDLNISISAQKCLFDINANTAIYENNVSGIGNGFEIHANKAVIKYSIVNNVQSIENILAEGKVTITKDNKTSRSDKAELVPKNYTLVLTGNPSINENNNKINGDKIVYNYMTEKIEIESASGVYKNN